MTLLRALLAAVVVGVAVWFYVAAATQHAALVNTLKSRGDQTGYLWDAQNVYHNAHGRRPQVMIGERNRMPLYAGVLSLLYRPSMTDPEFFEVAKTANIYLSVLLLVVVAGICMAHGPPLAAINMTGIAMFGWFIYKAGYTQSELLFYTLFFIAFTACWHALRAPVGRRMAVWGALAGASCGLAHLAKASVPPLVVIFLAAFVGQALWSPERRNLSSLAGASASLVAFVAACALVVWPYVSTSKRHFGHYLYNVNSTFYAWYDDWPDASVGVRLHGDSLHWPDVPPDQIPSAARYWREHTVAQIAARIGAGLRDMAAVSVRGYDYLRYCLLYAAVLLAIAVTRWSAFRGCAMRQPGLVVFLLLYFAGYAIATAFYFPISGTGTARFLIAHLLPFFFVATQATNSTAFSALRWQLLGTEVELSHFHLLVTATLILTTTFHTWGRVMTTYGGF